jgi:transcriptional regulatory protein RtcR
MGTLCDGGRITKDIVDDEITRLKTKWRTAPKKPNSPTQVIEPILGVALCAQIDYLDQIMLAEIIKTCKDSSSMAEAGRTLFNISRNTKKSNNDSHRVRQLLNKYGLDFQNLLADT